MCFIIDPAVLFPVNLFNILEISIKYIFPNRQLFFKLQKYPGKICAYSYTVLLKDSCSNSTFLCTVHAQISLYIITQSVIQHSYILKLYSPAPFWKIRFSMLLELYMWISMWLLLEWCRYWQKKLCSSKQTGLYMQTKNHFSRTIMWSRIIWA